MNAFLRSALPDRSCYSPAALENCFDSELMRRSPVRGGFCDETSQSRQMVAPAADHENYGAMLVLVDDTSY